MGITGLKPDVGELDGCCFYCFHGFIIYWGCAPGSGTVSISWDDALYPGTMPQVVMCEAFSLFGRDDVSDYAVL